MERGRLTPAESATPKAVGFRAATAVIIFVFSPVLGIVGFFVFLPGIFAVRKL
jgi:hypothetical protein